jgi:glyoxylate reductase
MKTVYMFEPPRNGLELLEKEGIPHVYYPGRQAPPEWLEKELHDAVVLVAAPWNTVTRDLIEKAGGLRLIMVQGSGLDKVDIEAATQRGVCVANAPDYIAETVADHIMALILAHYRNIVRGDRYVREGRWTSGVPQSLVGRTLSGKQVGIVGMGRIGASLARRLKPFGARIVYWDRRAKPEIEHALEAQRMDLDQLLETSDVVAITVALTPETRGLVNRERVFRMKKGALLVNTARGPIVDEKALAERLGQGDIYAALDVFETEPLPQDSPLMRLENTILTPHLGGFSWEALSETARFVAESVARFIKQGRLPETVVNKC